MKKLLMIVCLIAATHCATAQQIITSPASINMADSDFTDIYGSVAEYNLQQNAFRDDRAILFTGSKITYLKTFCKELAMLGYSKEVVMDDADNWVSFEMQPTVYQSEKKQYILIKAYYTPVDMRMKKVQITGTPQLLAKLFIYYWGNNMAEGAFDKNSQVFKDNASDHIVFDWLGASPKITITKNNKISGLF